MSIKKSNTKQIILYIIFDYISAVTAWSIFYIFRKVYIESEKFGYAIDIEFSKNYFIGVFGLALFWVILYSLIGFYKVQFVRSRLKELGQSLLITIIGVIIIFIVLILDDTIVNHRSYYFSISVLFLLHFFISYIPRLIITNSIIKNIKKGKIVYNTLIIGNNGTALNIYNAFQDLYEPVGYNFVGFVSIDNSIDKKLTNKLKHLGNILLLNQVIKENNIVNVIIAIKSYEYNKISEIINELFQFNISIKIVPGLYNMLIGRAKMSNLYNPPLIEVTYDMMSEWQKVAKQIIDICFSSLFIIFFSPLYILIAIGIKLSSKGPIFYKQKRIGKNTTPFIIYKFRTMIIDAEKGTPQLSSPNDKRITKFGFWLRKYRLDEIPQFFNVIKGNMSLVGPRPERQFYINQIVKKAPHYLHLLKVKPGITSWGQVRYGYAENVEEMILRLKYDILYIENMSLYIDFKILIYTIKTVLEANGK